jgi:hypothetical protein
MRCAESWRKPSATRFLPFPFVFVYGHCVFVRIDLEPIAMSIELKPKLPWSVTVACTIAAQFRRQQIVPRDADVQAGHCTFYVLERNTGQNSLDRRRVRSGGF